MRYMRPVILHLFQRYSNDNEGEYKAVLNVIYAGRIPTGIKHCPTFSDEENLEESLRYNFLTNDGIYVKKCLNKYFFWNKKKTGFEENLMGYQGNMLFLELQSHDSANCGTFLDFFDRSRGVFLLKNYGGNIKRYAGWK